MVNIFSKTYKIFGKTCETFSEIYGIFLLKFVFEFTHFVSKNNNKIYGLFLDKCAKSKHILTDQYSLKSCSNA